MFAPSLELVQQYSDVIISAADPQDRRIQELIRDYILTNLSPDPKTGRHVKITHTGYVQIDDDVEIGANTTVDRGRFGKTHIGEGVKIDNLVQIAHNVTIGAHSIIVSQTGISGSTSLGSYVTLAGQVGLAGHLTIGDRATITAQSGLNKDVPAGAVLSGHHATPIRENLKVEALTRRLPEWVERLKALEEKVRSLP